MKICIARGLGAAALTGAAFLAAGPLIPIAQANEDPAANPPNCSAADLEGVRAGVDAATSAYLFTHPDLNAYMSSLKGLTREQVGPKVQSYLASHPDEQADMVGIRQPLMDIKTRCGVPPGSGPGGQ